MYDANATAIESSKKTFAKKEGLFLKNKPWFSAGILVLVLVEESAFFWFHHRNCANVPPLLPTTHHSDDASMYHAHT